MRLILVAPALSLMCASAGAQTLASRAESIRDGALTFRFPARAGVCGDGQTFIRYGRSYFGSFSTSARTRVCDDGPVQVIVTMHDGKPEHLETRVGRVRQRDAKDLGEVSAREGARYLLDLATSAANGVASKAILGAVLADSAVVWPQLLKIARDTDTRSSGTRQEAAMWLARFAAAAADGKPNTLFEEDEADENENLKTHAVFVLSQLPHHSGVPDLLSVARSARDAHVRSSALFWLSQSGDPRAIDLFESMLKG